MSPHRILIVHNAYQQSGGEDRVVADEAALLARRGHEVLEMRRDNHEVALTGRLRLAAETLWSRRTSREARELLRRFRPDVVHVHNTLPLVSPSLYWACAEAGVPVVQTLHNFRLACPQAMFLRDGAVCERCVGRLPWPAVRHGCYRDSHAQTAVVAGMLALHRGLGTYREKVARYIALNEFCRAKFIEAGLPADRIMVKPNFAEIAPAGQQDGARHGFLFVGRLSPEKGIAALAQAWDGRTGASLRVAGTGPAGGEIASRPGVAMLGALSQDSVQREMRAALALVMPSIWYENFPRTLVEAFGVGLPVIASRLGALAELVEDGVTGLLFAPGDPDALAERLRWAADNPQRMAWMGANARGRFEALYTPETNYARLIEIYEAAMADREATEETHA
jgi:glycosyltransferase involved in cell wall biosynthesis